MSFAGDKLKDSGFIRDIRQKTERAAILNLKIEFQPILRLAPNSETPAPELLHCHNDYDVYNPRQAVQQTEACSLQTIVRHQPKPCMFEQKVPGLVAIRQSSARTVPGGNVQRWSTRPAACNLLVILLIEAPLTTLQAPGPHSTVPFRTERSRLRFGTSSRSEGGPRMRPRCTPSTRCRSASSGFRPHEARGWCLEKGGAEVQTRQKLLWARGEHRHEEAAKRVMIQSLPCEKTVWSASVAG